MTTRFAVTGEHWRVLTESARDNVYQDTYEIHCGFSSCHRVALDLIDLGLIHRPEHGGAQYVPTDLGRQVIEAGAGALMAWDGARWTLATVEPTGGQP